VPYFVHHDRRLFYRQQGSGPLLLILPGNTSSSATHQSELAHFGQRYHAVALDFWGTGRSDRAETWPDDWWAQGARDAATLVKHLGYKECLAVGSSGGGVVALLMAIQFPGYVRAVIADSCVERLPPERLRAEVATRARRTPEQAAFWRCAHGDDWQQVVDADSHRLLRLAQRGGDWFGGRLGEVRCPVLFTASLRDDALPDVTQQVCGMASQIRGSRIFFASEGGHPLMWSRPEDLKQAADCFLAALGDERADWNFKD